MKPRYVVLTALLLLVGTVGVMAASTNPRSPQKPFIPSGMRGPVGTMYDRGEIWKLIELDVTALPTPVQPASASRAPVTVPRDIPKAGIAGDSNVARHGAIPGGGGASLGTPRQRADRDISRLIRRLN